MKNFTGTTQTKEIEVNDYTIYRADLKKAYRKALGKLKEVREKSYYYQSGENSFVTYKELAKAACNAQVFREIDGGEAIKSIEKVEWLSLGDSFHKICAILDGAIYLMEANEVVVKPFKNEDSPGINISNHINVEVVIQNFIQDITENAKRFAEGSSEKAFLEKLKDNVKNVKNIYEIVKTVIRLAHEYGVYDKLVHIFSN